MRTNDHLRALASGAAAAAVVAGLGAGPAWSQPVPTPPVTADEERTERVGIDEIVVTATKRTESLQDVPVAVTVVTGDQLVGDFLTDLTDLQRLAPTVTFGQGSSTGTSTILLRGIGTGVFDPQVEPTVSVVVDGVVLGRNSQGFTDLIDIERVEVLKGPQGTLFGKNASGGVINIVTKRPSEELSAEVEGLAAELGERQVRGTVSAPLGDTLGARLTGFYKTIDGNIENTFDDRTFGGQESWGVRGKLEWAPSDAANVYLIADYRDFYQDASEETLRVSGQDGLTAALSAAGVVIGEDNRRSSTFAPIFEDVEDYGVSLQGDFDVGAVTITSQTAYRRFTSESSDDVDALANDPSAPGAGLVTNSFLTPFSGAALAGPADIIQAGTTDLEQLSEELRITSAPGRFEYVAGLFASLVTIDGTFERTSDACIAPLGQALGPLTAGAPCVPNAVLPVAPGVFLPDLVPLSTLTAAQGGPSITGRVFSEIETQNYAAFGQGTFEVTDRLALLGGLRVQHDVVEVDSQQPEPTSALGLSPEPFALAGETEETELSGKAGVEYDLGGDLLYATYSRGYKGPTIDFDPAGNETDVAPETSDGFELGLKTTSFDRRLILNLAAFWVEYDDFQAEAYDPTTAFFILQNVGSVRTRGVEADFIAQPTEFFTLTGGIAYVDAEVLDFPGGPCFVPPTEDPGCDLATVTKDLSGADLPNAPDLKGNLTADYEAPVGGQGLRFGARATVTYQDEVNFSLSQDPNTVQEDYALLDASLRLVGADERWQLSVFARNLLDQEYTVSQFQDFTSFTTAQTFQRVPLGAERRFGASLRLRY